MATHNGTGTYACEKQLALLQRAGVFNIALARTRLPADKRRKKGGVNGERFRSNDRGEKEGGGTGQDYGTSAGTA